MKRRQELKRLYQTSEFHRKYHYKKRDLGALCTEEGTSFLLWSPLAKEVRLQLYHDGEQGECFEEIVMQKEAQGVWAYRTKKDWHGIYYTYKIVHEEETVTAGDPYARACGVNGIRSMVVDLKQTDPDGWEADQRPEAGSENIIYELHVKEFSWDRSGGFSEEYRGKYKAFTEEHTTLYGDGIHPTGLDYLKELGVTHIQIMPAYDYGSVDEAKEEGFNWGYDPENYNVPEGSYATDAAHGEVRIREFKEMVQSLHRNGFRVIMDVVYNHMYALDNNLNKAVPWYYFRTQEDGTVSNGSACGNDVASERPMCAEYILNSVLYWAEEYHIDGFRFDLMGLLDVDLMNRIRRALDERYGEGEILLFGEPWAADQTAMEGDAVLALKENIGRLDRGVGMFCDDTRDAIKGHVFEAKIPGFVNGAEGMEQKIFESVRAWCKGGGSGKEKAKAKAPSQVITYVSAHDNWTLWDKLGKTIADEEERLRVNKMAAAVYMTCQGNLFFLSGEEFARTKEGLENTYNAPIELNRLDWQRAYAYSDLRRYYQGLIALRKQLPGLCDKSAQAWKRIYGEWTKPGVVGFFVDNCEGEGSTAWKSVSRWKRLCIIYNSTDTFVEKDLPDGTWEVLLDGERSFCWKEEICAEKAVAAPHSVAVFGERV